MNTQVRLFDANDKLVPNFNEEIEKILISVHGEKYYDIDEELVNTNEIPVVQEEIEQTPVEEIKETKEVVKKEKTKNNKATFKDFIPVLFFVLIFIVIVIAGYYFLNTVDLMNLIGASK